MIIFGEFIFYLILSGFLILESAFIYNSKFFESFISMIVIVGLGYFLVKDIPAIDFRYLLFYPLCAVVWMPIYWYLKLIKIASEIRKGINKSGSIENFVRSLSYGSEYRRHFDENRNVDIKNPLKEDIIANTVFFPISIPVFFLDGIINYTYLLVINYMDSIRKSLSEKLNRV